MHIQDSKQSGSLFTVLTLMVVLLGLPASPAQAGAPASAHLLSTTIMSATHIPVDRSGAQGKIAPADSVFNIFLPLVLKPAPRGIYGTVKENGTPVAGVPLDLRRYSGTNFTTFASTTTASDGSYSFTGATSLSSGQFYYVRYDNASNANRVWTWHTQALTTFTAGDEVNIGNFDLANIALVSPSDGVTVSLPRSFQWTPRSVSPTDSYEFVLYDVDFDPYFSTPSPLGYVGNYTLNSLPAGFSTGVVYGWEIRAHSPDGGFGISYELRLIRFSNSGLSAGAATQPTQPKSMFDLENRYRK